MLEPPLIHIMYAYSSDSRGDWDMQTFCNLSWTSWDPPPWVDAAPTCISCISEFDARYRHASAGRRPCPRMVRGRLVELHEPPSRAI